MSSLAGKLYRELQQRIFVEIWIGKRRWKALIPNFKMARNSSNVMCAYQVHCDEHTTGMKIVFFA